MRIGIDARELCGRPTGVGRYLRGLLSAWASDGDLQPHEYVLYAPEPLGVTLDSPRLLTRTVPGPGGSWWEQVRLPAAAARDRLDVFFAPAYSAPLRLQIPTVVALHDLSFVAHPEWFSAREGARRRWLARQSAARASAVITISDFSRREILDRFGIADERIHVIRPGITAPAGAPAASFMGGGLRLLFVGSIFNRRRLPDLIRACAPLARRDPRVQLDIVGDNRTYPRQDLARTIATEGLASQIRWRPYVEEDELAGLFGTARAFAFLSEYEGLGLTPLEAIAAGVPPVLLDTPVARESCGAAALYVAVGDLQATTEALRVLLYDDQRRATLLAAAPATLERYSWPRAARETLAVLEKSVSCLPSVASSL